MVDVDPNGRQRLDLLQVAFARRSGQLNLAVADNGIGFPPDLDFRNTTSLGLHLVNSLVSQLEGTIELNSHGGTEFKITFAPF